MEGAVGVPLPALEGAQVIARLRQEVDEVVIAGAKGEPVVVATKVANAGGRNATSPSDDLATGLTTVPDVDD